MYLCTPTLKDCNFLAVGASCRRDLGKSFQIGTTHAGDFIISHMDKQIILFVGRGEKTRVRMVSVPKCTLEILHMGHAHR